MKNVSETIVREIHDFVLSGINLGEGRIKGDETEFWRALKDTGTELWLDTGDLKHAERVWTAEMSALTTNNTLLCKEIHKGIYDEYIKEANKILETLPMETRVVEIAFILNARYGLKLIQRFGGKVSVELHANFAHDLEGILFYGKRLLNICRDHFIIKIPYTATGLLGARMLREEGIPINFTLEFSARQNAIATVVTKPDYLNVFLGRLNAYVFDNNLGDGQLIGEKATMASQRIVRKLSSRNRWPTKQIAASMRCGDQLFSLAGVDVFTIPPNVAQEARNTKNFEFSDKTDINYEIEIARNIDPEDVKLYNLWHVSDKELKLADYLDKNLPASDTELELIARNMDCEDMFPVLSKQDLSYIEKDGKIPRHERWKERIRNGKIAIDTLFNLAGLASFTNDQAAFDTRIRKLIT